MKTACFSQTNNKNIAPIRHAAKQPSESRIKRLLEKKKQKRLIKNG